MTPLKKGIFLPLLSWCVAMTVSAIYEIIEWLLSLSAPNETEAFLVLKDIFMILNLIC